ncbi:hypothetical protein [Halomonas sp. BM-2019]|uniref:hypothetical protein n=1 Tax=Halomonas sp. BM-2019 TaxID=2811227 RepID=UPI001B3C24A3|nr:MAG: hypothetical protein J5F18_04940 [Halomonas sp. BM-2019]
MPDTRRFTSLGIVSLLMALFGGVFLGGLTLVASIIASSAPDEGAAPAAGPGLIGVELLFLVGLQAIAIGMGVAALRRSDERRAFALLGIVLGAVVILLAVGLGLGGRLP